MVALAKGVGDGRTFLPRRNVIESFIDRRVRRETYPFEWTAIILAAVAGESNTTSQHRDNVFYLSLLFHSSSFGASCREVSLG